MIPSIAISVLSLFQPASVTLQAAPGASLAVDSREVSRLTFTVHDREIAVRSARPITIAIAGKISRAYPSPLRLRTQAGVVQVLVNVPIETAVAWAVAAESAPAARSEALKAMAVVARSWYTAARGRHTDFDFCDTTHCQFLGPAKASAASVASTRGSVLLFDGNPVEAMHSADCGGQTKSLAAVGLTVNSYPFYQVQCDSSSAAWSRTLTPSEANALKAAPHSENARLRICRRGGWDRVPSNQYTLDGLTLTGHGRGHGVGLCQQGAAKMAAAGKDYLAILRHYFPNTAIGTAP